uniref:NADH-ubiquinone oxidoreductase chain 5 n=1 Tax=Bovicola caprae TaxID=1647116 RepID=A0A3P8MXI3_9NEOP|nr:NADH dehydrogenase subunit 5 [Bovicola caprae]
MLKEKKFYPLVFSLKALLVIAVFSSVGEKIFSMSKSVGMLFPWGFCWSFSVDYISSLFLVMVCCVSISVFAYSWGYLQGEGMWNKFIQTLLLFTLSMMILSLSSSVMSTMVGWDGLGLSSVALIFFYCGWVSFRNGMVTFFCNRVGDVFFMIFITLISISPYGLTTEHGVSLLISAITKSAQVPFHIWLPMAMAAPTPVSSLVHSSTLVTGGIFILVRYGAEVNFLDELGVVLFSLSSLTLLFSGVSSIFETDLKKVIALSTLVHISLIMVFISLGDHFPALAHLLCHAFMKSGLFMVGGWMIHEMGGSQDIRASSVNPSGSPSWSFLLSVFLLSMVGFPFLSGFCSKELMLGSLFEDSGFSISTVVVYFGLFSSSMYSFRLFFSLSQVTSFSFTWSNWGSEKGMLYPLFISMIGALVVGMGLSLVLFSIEKFQESMYAFLTEKLLVVVLVILSVFLICLLVAIQWDSKLFAVWSKMSLFSSSLGDMLGRLVNPIRKIQALDKEGFFGLGVKVMSFFVQDLTKLPVPLFEGSKSQLLKLGLLFVLILSFTSMGSLLSL